MRSQFWDLDFTQGASHDSGPAIFLSHDFQDMDGEPGDFTVAEGHGYPLVHNITLHRVKTMLWNKEKNYRNSTEARDVRLNVGCLGSPSL